jgi:glycosyltransferase involved in cell wall biosynthesis
LAGKVRLLFISSFYLFPETRFGGSKRLYYFAREWARSSELSVICMDACREWTPGAATPVEFKDFLMVPGADYPGYAERLLRTPADRRTVLEPHAEKIRAFLEGKRFDAIVLAYPWALSYLSGFLKEAGAPITYLEDDLLFEQFRKEARAPGNLIRRGWKRFRFMQTLAYYRPLMQRISRFIGISGQEAAVMQSQFPFLETGIIQYGIPMDDFPLLPSPAPGKVIGFLGNYGHPPNLDALAWLLETLAPAIRARSPEIRFLIAGKGIPDWAHSAAAADVGIEVRENVADLRTFYADIHVFLNPIRTGRGMRTKVIEAAAFGRPVISTTLGGEGMEYLQLEIADDAESLIDACVRFRSGSGASATAARNRAAVADRFSLEKVGGDFLSLVLTPLGTGGGSAARGNLRISGKAD